MSHPNPMIIGHLGFAPVDFALSAHDVVHRPQRRFEIRVFLVLTVGELGVMNAGARDECVIDSPGDSHLGVDANESLDRRERPIS